MSTEAKRKVLETNNPDVVLLPLQKALRKNGISIPRNPNSDSKIPRKWLLRSESNKDRLLDLNQRGFQPKSGQMGSFGVFLGDCFAPIMRHNPGAYYLFDRDTLATNWVCIPSEDYSKQMKEIGKKHNLAIDRTTDGLSAETILFERTATYQPASGIVTVPYLLDLSKATSIFLSSKFLSPEEMESLPDPLRGKIKIF